MSAAVRATYATRCAICRGPINKNDLIVYAPDDRGFCHEDCEPDYSPWHEATSASLPIIRFAQILRDHKTIMRACMESDLDTKRLPEAVAVALFELAAAEAHLACLVEDIQSEHVLDG